jgi:hypothetical protein
MDTNQHLHAFGSIDIDHRHSNARRAFAPAGRLRDSHSRAITDLRISVTDRCNYKCVYCRTGNEGAQFTELAIEDYLRMIRVFVRLCIEKVRLTGCEPLLRSGLVEMVQEVAQMRTAYTDDGVELLPGIPRQSRSTSLSPPTAIGEVAGAGGSLLASIQMLFAAGTSSIAAMLFPKAGVIAMTGSMCTLSALVWC